MPVSSTHKGWYWDRENSRLEFYYEGTKIGHINANGLFASTGSISPVSSDGAALGTSSLMWADVFLASGGVINFNNGDVTLTHAANTLTLGGASTGLVVSSGDVSASAAGAAFVAAAGNAELGNPGAFATTQPQGAVVMGGSSLGGIAPVGAITTAGAIFASDTVVRKIIAAGTATNIET